MPFFQTPLICNTYFLTGPWLGVLSSTFPIWVLHKSRGTAPLITLLRPKRACHGSAAPRRVDDYKGVCPPVHGPGLAPSTGVAHRGHPYPRDTDGDGRIAADGAGARTVLHLDFRNFFNLAGKEGR